jgi:hypothetical protein
MTNEDYSKVPPPHLLKKFSEQARVESQKRGHPGYCKTFAKLCIDWALNSKSSPNNPQIRSPDLDVTIALVQQWTNEIYNGPGAVVGSDDICLAKRAAQYGADQELEACRMEIIDGAGLFYIDETSDRVRLAEDIWTARRPKAPSLKKQALAALERYEAEEWCEEMTFDSSIIRRALEQLDD